MSDLAEILASFESMTESELRHEARRWAFNADSVAAKLRAHEGWARSHRDENMLKLARVAELVNVRRKTLKMADLIESLKESQP